MDVVKEKKQKDKAERATRRLDQYELPEHVKPFADQVQRDVLDFGVFQWDHQVYAQRSMGGDGEKGGPRFRFVAVSNFGIRILHHMRDEKRPSYLVRVENQHGRHEVFDTITDEMASGQAFKKLCLRFGNYHWQGNATDFDRLLGLLLERMGHGQAIHSLGWQPWQPQHQLGGFFAFSNALVNGQVYELDRYGCAEVDGRSYYVPAGNSLHAANEFKHQAAKRVHLFQGGPSWEQYAQQVVKVHRNHGMVGLVFAVATVFSDFIFEVVKGFPMLFLYGEAGTGKGELVQAMQGLFGIPQDGISLTGKANTDKGKLRMFAEFNGLLMFLDEYRNSMPEEMFEVLKSIWDRRGYRRGTIESAYGTETVPIRCTAVVAGNYYPAQDDALLTRLLVDEMERTSFEDEDRRQFNKLKDMLADGVSGVLVEVLAHRQAFVQEFTEAFRQVKQETHERIGLKLNTDRMVVNTAVLVATHRVLQQRLAWPFTNTQLATYLDRMVVLQQEKRGQGTDVAQFFDVFLSLCRDRKVQAGQQFKVDGTVLSFYLGEVFGEYRVRHAAMYRTNGLERATLLDKLKRHECFVEMASSCRIGNRKSSAVVVDLDKLDAGLVGLLSEIPPAPKPDGTQPPGAEPLPF